MPFCNACGKQNRDQARFCGYCGQPLQVQASEPLAKAGEPPPQPEPKSKSVTVSGFTKGNNLVDSPGQVWEDWRQNPFRLVSLMTLLRANAEAFCNLSLIGQVIAYLEAPVPINDHVFDALSRF
jgi:hypothetical protein